MEGLDSVLVRQTVSLVGYYGGCRIVESVARMSTRTAGSDSAKFVKRLMDRGHMSPLEFVWLDFDITTSRAIANELVRHRIASYCQESTRYVDMRSGARFILPRRMRGNDERSERLRRMYAGHCCSCLDAYEAMLSEGLPRETARDVLPLGLATRIRAGMNMRSFRNFLQQRLARSAADDMRVLACLMYEEAMFNYHDLLPMLEDLSELAEDVGCLE